MISRKFNTLVVNLFAGSGAGKSSNAYIIAGLLKMRGVETEYISEFAKQLCWEHRNKAFELQPYIFGKQLKKQFYINENTQVIISDSPILLSALYDPQQDEDLRKYIIKTFNKFNNYNIFLNRGDVKFSPIGRNESNVKESEKFDIKLKNFLNENNIPYVEEVNKVGYKQLDNCKRIVEDIISRLVVDKIYDARG